MEASPTSAAFPFSAQAWLAGWLFLACLLAPHDCRAAHFNASACAPTGFATADNDIRLDNDHRKAGKPIALPSAVAEKVRAIAVHALASNPELAEDLTCRLLEELVYRVSGFGPDDLYVANVAIPTGPSYFFLILHDTASGRVTQDPPRIGSKWPGLFGAQDPLVRTPLVSSTDLLRNGRHQIVFEERVHNGTMYNAVIYHYFDLGPRLELNRILSRETRVLGLSDDGIEYQRELQPIGENKLRLELLETSAKPNGHPKRLGYSILESTGPGVAFHVLTRHVSPGVAASALVTDCDSSSSDDVFLRDGCDFYY